MLRRRDGGGSIEETLDWIRGSFALHTRGYNAHREAPLHPNSTFGLLYARARAVAQTRVSEGIPLTPLGPRTASERSKFAAEVNRRGHNVVEPTWLPPGPGLTVTIAVPTAAETVLTGARPKSIGDTPEVLLRSQRARREESEWQWHPGPGGQRGHLRPALRRAMGGGMWGRIMCLAGAHWKPRSAWDGTPFTQVCDPERQALVWELDAPVEGVALTGRIRNVAEGRCLGRDAANAEAVRMQPCEDADANHQLWLVRVMQ